MEVRSCLVVTPPGNAFPHAIRDPLDAAGCKIDVFDDPLCAFAEAALRERLAAKRAAWGLETPGRTCLVIHRPDDVSELPLLLAASKTYLPLVAIALHDPDGGEPWQDAEGRPIHASVCADDDAPVETASEAPASTPPCDPASKREESTSALRSPAHAPRRQSARSLRLVNTDDGKRKRMHESQARESHAEGRDEEDPIPTVTREELAMLLNPDDEFGEDRARAEDES